ncbi:hypothetical protein BDZ89DRAFT_500945 [Hymenopellis radicata]|nr:hypothetical protein BDZ89DRAFT_500945 [Hymenopellis radicata]
MPLSKISAAPAFKLCWHNIANRFHPHHHHLQSHCRWMSEWEPHVARKESDADRTPIGLNVAAAHQITTLAAAFFTGMLYIYIIIRNGPMSFSLPHFI